jgi:hypothetical protein
LRINGELDLVGARRKGMWLLCKFFPTEQRFLPDTMLFSHI